MENILAFLPKQISEKIRELPAPILNTMEEIRIRINRPLEVSTRGKPYFLPYLVSEQDAEQLINKLANYSFYT
ncbi:stage III sporulation protein AA, partial [Heyndrickxia sporothermodurans]